MKTANSKFIVILLLASAIVGIVVYLFLKKWSGTGSRSRFKYDTTPLSITTRLYPDTMTSLSVADMKQHIQFQPKCLFFYDPKILTSQWANMNLNEIINYLRQQGEAMRLMVTPTGIVGWYDPRQILVTLDKKRRKIWGKSKSNQSLPQFELKHYQHDRNADNLDYYNQNPNKKKKKFILSPDEKYYLRTLPAIPGTATVKNYYREALPDCIPIDEKTVENVNFYISGAGITTNLHFDGRSGVVVQLKGRKRIYVFPKEQMHLFDLYPMEHPLMRRSKIDGRLTNATLDKHPQLQSARGYECILEPGTWLYIPAQWMHYVESLDSETFSLIVRFTK